MIDCGMTSFLKRLFPRFLISGAVASVVSCGSLVSPSAQNSEPNEQTLDPGEVSVQAARVGFRAIVLSAVRQPVTTVRQGLSVFYHRPREVVVGNIPLEQIPEEQTPFAPGTPGFEKLLDEKGFPETHYGRLKWLVDWPGFFTELDKQIAGAKQSIHAQFYIFDNDEIAVRYADKLKARSSDVAVRVLYDDFGTLTSHLSSPLTPPQDDFVPPADMRDYLRDGSEVKVRLGLNPWLVADHTKLLVFDSRTAILGGMNLGREYYSEWHDLMVRVEGPAVGKLAEEFSRAWRMNGPWGDLALLTPDRKYTAPPRADGDIPLRILRTESSHGRQEILNASLLAIRGAKRRIYIENPYFASDEIVAALRLAVKRGVDVRVILAAEGDSAIMDVGNLATARVLIEEGAKFYRYPKMAHLKVMVCDDWATVGSANLDTLSMRINRELNIAFSDKAEVERLVAKIFRPDFAKSKRMRLEDTESATAPLAEILADQL